uniref:RGS domain-containing protein n=1 Tax=Steinernema glaseri TaxID=37863 RepID=A0A1I7YPU9_9BILA
MSGGRPIIKWFLSRLQNENEGQLMKSCVGSTFGGYRTLVASSRTNSACREGGYSITTTTKETLKRQSSVKIKLSMRSVRSSEGDQRRESEYIWNGAEEDLPLGENDPLLYECVALYLGCVNISYESVHTEILDKAIRHLHDVDSPARTVFVQVHQTYTRIRNSSNKVCMMLPNESIRVCLSSPETPMCMGLIMTKSDGGRECFVFGIDRNLLHHNSQQHMKYVEKFNLNCASSASRGIACSAFPASPARLMHYLNDAKTFLLQSKSRGCGVFLSSVKTQISAFCTPKKLKDPPLDRPSNMQYFLIPDKEPDHREHQPKARRGAEMFAGSKLSRWKYFEVVVNDKDGFELLRSHMQEEKSEENLDFWARCRQLEEEWNEDAAKVLYEQFVKVNAPKEVNLDSDIRKLLAYSLTKETIEAARRHIGSLIERDPFQRFLKTRIFSDLVRARMASEEL